MGSLLSFALLALLASGCAQQAPPSKAVVPIASGEAAEPVPPATGDGQGMPTGAKVAIAVGTGVLAGVLIFSALGAVAAAAALGSG